eukprot:gene13553-biopygen5033
MGITVRLIVKMCPCGAVHIPTHSESSVHLSSFFVSFWSAQRRTGKSAGPRVRRWTGQVRWKSVPRLQKSVCHRDTDSCHRGTGFSEIGVPVAHIGVLMAQMGVPGQDPVSPMTGTGVPRWQERALPPRISVLPPQESDPPPPKSDLPPPQKKCRHRGKVPGGGGGGPLETGPAKSSILQGHPFRAPEKVVL